MRFIKFDVQIKHSKVSIEIKFHQFYFISKNTSKDNFFLLNSKLIDFMQPLILCILPMSNG